MARGVSFEVRDLPLYPHLSEMGEQQRPDFFRQGADCQNFLPGGFFFRDGLEIQIKLHIGSGAQSPVALRTRPITSAAADRARSVPSARMQCRLPGLLTISSRRFRMGAK